MSEPAVALPLVEPAPPRPSMARRVAALTERVARARQPGAAAAVLAQRARGKMTARDRVLALLDEDTFHELQALRHHRSTGFGMADRHPDGDGVITGWGRVHGARVFVYAHDFTVFGGSLGEEHALKIQRLLDLAHDARCPVVALCDGAGARIQEGVSALAGYGGIFRRTVRNSGVVPQISVVMGPCAGGAAYAPALTDLVFMIEGTSQMFITGPDVVAAVTGAATDHEQLGGAGVHAAGSGVAAAAYADERACLEDVRYLLSLLPPCNDTPPEAYGVQDPPDRACPRLASLVPADPVQGYDVRQVIEEVVDEHDFFELHERWAPNLVVGLARWAGRTVGVLANQPVVLAGALDIAASEKGARFVQFCDAFEIPLVTLVDVPGFLPGLDQEHGGIIRHGAKLLYAYCAATVPRVQVILRKAYGGAYIVMDSPSTGCDVSLAWPTNELAVMGPEAAVEVIHRRRIAAASDPAGTRDELIEQYRAELMHPFWAAERGLVDEVIDPADTRRRVSEALTLLGRSRPGPSHRKHGNPPQ